MSFIIRQTSISEAYDVAKVHVLSWQSAYKGIILDDYLNNMSVETRAEKFKNNYDTVKDDSFVAVEDEKIIGVLAVHKCFDADVVDCGEVEAIYLLPEFWGSGYGKQLMDFAINALKERGYNDIYLWVLEENIRARRFYEKYGFVADGTSKEINIGKLLAEMRYLLRTE